MSTQPFSSLETTTPLATKDTTEHQGTHLLDGPWKVRVLPEEPELPMAAPTQPAKVEPSGESFTTPQPANVESGVQPVQWLPAPDPHVAKSLPWRRGDVTRLKDDSPKGMMEYIATHTSGWWQEMAERALRDTQKAERMAREAGWQPGQYWSLEVDAEASPKLLEAEEAKRQREEAERAKEAAEKETLMQRQMELLKKAGRAPRCEYVYTDGRSCRAPQVKGEHWCHGHAKMMSYRPEKLELEPMEDEQAVMVNLYRVTKSLLAGRISEKTAGLMLWSVAIAAPSVKRVKMFGREPRRSRGIARDRNVIARDRKGKPKTFETRRNGVGGGKMLSRELTRMKKQKTHRGGAETRRKTRKDLPHSNSGVTNDKSFVSGVEGQVPPATRTNDSESRENPLVQHGQTQHSRDLSTPPRVAAASSESLKMTRGRGHRKSSEHRDPSCQSHPSAPPCLRGENQLRTTKDTKEHEGGTAGKHSSRSRLRCGEPSSSIRVDPRKSAVSSCSSSASPRLRGENQQLQNAPSGL